MQKAAALLDVPSRRRRVVLAEDDPDTLRLLREIVRLDGYEVVEMENGARLLEYVETFPFGELRAGDIILTDIRMPFVSGLDVLLEVKRRRLPVSVVLISAYSDKLKEDLARSGGAVALLSKPLAVERLLPLLARLDRWN